MDDQELKRTILRTLILKGYPVMAGEENMPKLQKIFEYVKMKGTSGDLERTILEAAKKIW